MQTTAATPLRLKISIPEGALPGTILSFSHPHDEEQEIQMVVQEYMMFSSEFTLHHGPTHPAAESTSSPSTPSLDLQHTAQDTSSSPPSKKQKIDVTDTVENLVQRYVLRVKEIAEKIRGQPFWTTIVTSLDILRSKPIELVCYGLGRVTNDRPGCADQTNVSLNVSIYQLGLLVLLAEHLSLSGSSVQYFDPSFDREYTFGPIVNHRIMTEFGFTTIPTNEIGARRVTVPTLFYMPRCSINLHNNLCEANEENSSLLLGWIGNDISSKMPATDDAALVLSATEWMVVPEDATSAKKKILRAGGASWKEGETTAQSFQRMCPWTARAASRVQETLLHERATEGEYGDAAKSGDTAEFDTAFGGHTLVAFVDVEKK